ncbi:unnamed protein product, partial [Mesorhabditis spiculigera]
MVLKPIVLEHVLQGPSFKTLVDHFMANTDENSPLFEERKGHIRDALDHTFDMLIKQYSHLKADTDLAKPVNVPPTKETTRKRRDPRAAAVAALFSDEFLGQLVDGTALRLVVEEKERQKRSEAFLASLVKQRLHDEHQPAHPHPEDAEERRAADEPRKRVKRGVTIIRSIIEENRRLKRDSTMEDKAKASLRVLRKAFVDPILEPIEYVGRHLGMNIGGDDHVEAKEEKLTAEPVDIVRPARSLPNPVIQEEEIDPVHIPEQPMTKEERADQQDVMDAYARYISWNPSGWKADADPKTRKRRSADGFKVTGALAFINKQSSDQPEDQKPIRSASSIADAIARLLH